MSMGFNGGQMIDNDSEVFFSEDDHLWMVVTDSKLPAELMVKHPELFMIEHDPPCRVMVDLTAYISLIGDLRR
jgi:hypothetical protein